MGSSGGGYARQRNWISVTKLYMHVSICLSYAQKYMFHSEVYVSFECFCSHHFFVYSYQSIVLIGFLYSPVACSFCSLYISASSLYTLTVQLYVSVTKVYMHVSIWQIPVCIMPGAYPPWITQTHHGKNDVT